MSSVNNHHLTTKETPTVINFECDPKCMTSVSADCDCKCEGRGHGIGLENNRDRNGRFIPLTTSARIRRLARQGVATSAIAKQVGVSFHHAYSVIRTGQRKGLLAQ